MNIKEFVETIDRSFTFKNKHGGEIIFIGAMDWANMKEKIEE